MASSGKYLHNLACSNHSSRPARGPSLAGPGLGTVETMVPDYKCKVTTVIVARPSLQEDLFGCRAMSAWTYCCQDRYMRRCGVIRGRYSAGVGGQLELAGLT